MSLEISSWTFSFQKTAFIDSNLIKLWLLEFCNLQFAINTSKPPAPVALQGRLCLSGKPHEYKRSLVWLNLPPPDGALSWEKKCRW